MDINPAKQGKFLQGTGIIVLSPIEGMSLLEKGATIFVMNSNYIEEIKTISNHAFKCIGIDHE